jgi:SAM-dependent methyltransferase
MPLVKNAESLPSREFGLAIGLILGRFFVKMEDLHYGYWTDDLPIEMSNLEKAQAQYSDFLMSHIPEGMKSILDVGCGAGNTARKLLDRGYQVDCVSPNSILTSVAQEALGSRTTFFKCRFEDLQTDVTTCCSSVKVFCSCGWTKPLPKRCNFCGPAGIFS